MLLKAKSAVQRFRPDLVEFYGAEACLATRALSKLPNRAFQIVAHSNGLEPYVAETLAAARVFASPDGRKPKWYQGRISLPAEDAFRCADAIVTVSEPEAAYAARKGYQSAHLILAIDNPLSDAFLGQSIDHARPKVIGFCGSWIARKGTALLVEDIGCVLREEPDWRLHLVGVGEAFRAAAVFPPDVLAQISVTPFVTDKEDLKRIYHGWSIAVLPSIYESFGLVAAEAMSCGCALAANATGFAATLTAGMEAAVFSGPQSPFLYDAVTRLIRDPHYRNSVASAGWRRVQNLRWDRALDRLEEFYLRLCADEISSSPVPALQPHSIDA
jgi:glycosyltransferase involved in cell wall biosynthesis